MCGLVTLISPSKRPQGDVVAKMTSRLHHRGPDDCGRWSSTTTNCWVGLGHQRLKILDLSNAATQPMVSQDQKAVLVYNGEIYNYLELRKELVVLGVDFKTTSDTEVLLSSYQTWGTRCVEHFNGMFSFALWDAKQQVLLVARDRFGEKPLFYTELENGDLAFASEMKALLAHPKVSDLVNNRIVEKFLAGSYHESGEETMFKNIRRFPAAHAALFGANGREIKRWRYWTPDYLNLRENYNSKYAIETFHELFSNSVKNRLRSDVPVGSSLSGGIDSSAIVCEVNDIFNFRDNTSKQTVFSARFDDDKTISEGPEIDRVIAATGVTSYAISPLPAKLLEESAKLHWHQEEPFHSASAYLQWCVARLAQSENVTVLLDGQGADELLGGYAHYFRNFQLDQIERLKIYCAYRNSSLYKMRLLQASKKYVESHRRFSTSAVLSVAQLIKALIRHPRSWFNDYTVGLPPAERGGRFRRQLAEGLQYAGLPALLRIADRNAMAFGRETRLPFLDYELVDWCISLPNEAFIHNGWPKYILRAAASKKVPNEIRWAR